MWRSEGYKIFAEDEAMVSFNPSPRKLWAPKGSKPIQLVNGSHENVCFFGAVSDTVAYCEPTDWINQDSFIEFLIHMLKWHRKLVLVVDRASHHLHSEKVRRFVKDYGKNLILWELPRKLPELNPQEQGWKSARSDVTYKLFEAKKDMAFAIKGHLEQNFRVNLANFWG